MVNKNAQPSREKSPPVPESEWNHTFNPTTEKSYFWETVICYASGDLYTITITALARHLERTITCAVPTVTMVTCIAWKLRCSHEHEATLLAIQMNTSDDSWM